MGELAGWGKVLVGVGALLVVLGLVFILLSKLGISRLPGDVVVERKNFTFYAPVGLMILLSVVLTLVLNLLLRR